MNVLHVSENRIWGGNEQQLYSLIIGLQFLGVNQRLFCFNDSPLIKKLEHSDIEITAISKCKAVSKTYRESLKEIISSKKIDLLHLHTSSSLTGYVATDILHKLKVKAVFSKKAVSSNTSFLSKFKYNYSGLDSIICVSEYVKRNFKTILLSKNHYKLCVIYDGVSEKKHSNSELLNLKSKLGLEKSTFIIGNIANHTKAKDLQVLVETLNHLVNNLNVKDIHLIQIGNFTSRTEGLKEKVREYNLENYITFLGFSKNADLYHSQFNVFLMTSEREGGPTVIIESFKNKTPVVTTKVGLIDDCATNGENALVAEVGDYKSLGESIFRLKIDKSLRDHLALSAYSLFINNFTEKKFVHDTFEHYKKILKE